MHLYQLASEDSVIEAEIEAENCDEETVTVKQFKDDWEVNFRPADIHERPLVLKRAVDDSRLFVKKEESTTKQNQVLIYLLDFSKQLLEMYKSRGQLPEFKEIVYNLAVLYYCLPPAQRHKALVFYHQQIDTMPQSDMLDCFFLIEYFRQSRYSQESTTLVVA